MPPFRTRRPGLALLATVLLVLPVLAPARAQALATTTWDDRGSAVLSAPDALRALETLPADSPAPQSWGQGGSRTGWFGQAWEDVDGDGCDTRNEILGRDLQDADYSRRKGRQDRQEGQGQGAGVCPDATVWSGVLADPYTGATIEFSRGKDTSAQVQIDHVVPLNYLYAHGAWAWDARTRLLVANDPLNLLAVDGQANQSKGACGPATCPVGSSESGTWDTAAGQGWWPPDDAFRCAYAARFVSVLAGYSLGVPHADRQDLTRVLKDCAAGGDGAPSMVDRAGTVLPEAVRTVSRDPLLAVTCVVGPGLVMRARRRPSRRGRRR